MKILHTSDWHLGRMIYGRSLLEDQAYFIDQVFFPALERHRPDCVILAGDIFDRQIAPVEAIRLFDSVLSRIHQMGIPLAAISGNRDRSGSHCNWGGNAAAKRDLFGGSVGRFDSSPAAGKERGTGQSASVALL